MRRPLEGVRVLTIEHFGAGPYATQHMAELGAEVIKIEAPSTGGDTSRPTGPFMLGEHDSQYFQTFSRSKKSAAIELKTPEGRADFEGLVKTADAVVGNLRGDQPEKLRLTYAHLKALNPAIVCGHLSAYGRGNSRESWPGYDFPMQAEAGLMSMTGDPDAPPTRMGVSIIDFMTGTTFAFGVVSAILSARTTGVGCDIDVSLFDVALHQLSYPGIWTMNEGYDVGRLPNGAHAQLAPVQRVKTRDGYGQLMCMTQKFWLELCNIAGRPDLAADPRFADLKARRANLEALTAAVDEMFSTRTTAEWHEALGGRVPFGPVLDIHEALANPFVAEVAMRDVIDHPDRPQGLHMLASPVKVDGQRMPGKRAPKLGEHTTELLPSPQRDKGR
ncbi:MAG TPA: CoA transferase [Caulobacteraceae bacterium]|nr:CoA transferase [Caulobacteraceae bacterium]